MNLLAEYEKPDRRERACKYWWFDGWDWLVNRGLGVFGRVSIALAPGEIAIDPHVHSLYSHCSISHPELIILRAVRLGLSGVAVIDHNVVTGGNQAVLCASYLKGKGRIPESFVVIPGTEVNTTRGHIAALFVTTQIRDARPPADTAKEIHDAGGLAVAVHPYHSTGIGDAVFEAPFDLIETDCGSVFGGDHVRRNLALAEDERLASVPKIGGSDAHYIRAIGTCYTLIEGVQSPSLESIKSAMKEGRCAPRRSAPYGRMRKLLGGVPKLK